MRSWWMMRAHMCLWHKWSRFPTWNLLLPLHPGSCTLCEGCVRLWFWFPSSPQVCSRFMPRESRAQTHLLFNKWQISLSTTLPFLLPSLSDSIQHRSSLSPPRLHSIYSHDMQTRSSSFPNSLNIFFYSALFSVLIFRQAVRFFLHDIDRKQPGPMHSPS